MRVPFVVAVSAGLAALFVLSTAAANIPPTVRDVNTTVAHKSDRRVASFDERFAFSAVPYVDEQQHLAQVAPAAPATRQVAPGAVVETSGDVSANTKVSVGTWAGEALQTILSLFAIPIGGFIAMILFRVLKGVGVNLDTAHEQKLQDSINRAVVMFGNAAPRMLDGKINVDVKNDVIRKAIEFVKTQRADTIKALGSDPNSAKTEEALTARAEVAMADPAVPTPDVAAPAPTVSTGGATVVASADLEATIMRVLTAMHDRAKADATAAGLRAS